MGGEHVNIKDCILSLYYLIHKNENIRGNSQRHIYPFYRLLSSHLHIKLSIQLKTTLF